MYELFIFGLFALIFGTVSDYNWNKRECVAKKGQWAREAEPLRSFLKLAIVLPTYGSWVDLGYSVFKMEIVSQLSAVVRVKQEELH